MPSLAPIIPTPPHPSYPSGHALQAYLVAEILKAVAPTGFESYIDAMAERIAVNREIAGVHFPSDKIESKCLANAAFTKYLSSMLDHLINEASCEWSDAVNWDTFEPYEVTGPEGYLDQVVNGLRERGVELPTPGEGGE